MTSWLARGKKEDLYTLLGELDETCDIDLKVVQLRRKIIESKIFKEDTDFVKTLYEEIVISRLKEEAKREQQEEADRNFELEKLRLQLESQKAVSVSASLPEASTRFDLQKVLPHFNPEMDDINIFLVLLERQLKIFKISEDLWVTHLITCLPAEVSQLLAREPEEKFQNYEHIKNILLQRYKMTAEKFRKLFSQKRKSPTSTWKDYYFELRTYMEGWLNELKVTEFESLKGLIISDQLKKRSLPECKEHFLDEWEQLISPEDLADKLDSFDNLRSSNLRPDNKLFNIKGNSYHKPMNNKKETFPLNQLKPKVTQHEKLSLYCYGCGTPGFTKTKCPNCSSKKKETNFNFIKMFTCLISEDLPLIDISIYDTVGTVCVDTGASRSIGSELLFIFLKGRNHQFEETHISMSLADGQLSSPKVLTAKVPIKIHERTYHVDMIFLPDAKGNRTLLGVDFLLKSGLVLDIQCQTWYFNDKPHRKYPFSKNRIISNAHNKETELNSCSLRENEGENLTASQKRQLNVLLKLHESIFTPGGEPTPYLEHHINTEKHPPVSVPPYRMTPAKKELLKKEIEDLLQKDVIEECESAYGAPVVLIPKPDGTMRLCIDYRKLNEITIPDSYPLPRMDDLLQSAKHTTFMSTIDLKSGYHQISVHPDDRDKTAFVCPLGTFRFKRMPFGLRNAPATFQRLMDMFCRNLPAMAYLDDIIVLSPTFDKHMQDLEKVFRKLKDFKLRANRSKCHFACPRVKYLGLWITSRGIEVDPDKIEAVQRIPPPKNVKQDQSATLVHPLRKRGRPRKNNNPGSSPRRSDRNRNQRGSL